MISVPHSFWTKYSNEYGHKKQCKKTDGRMITNLRRQKSHVTKTIRAKPITPPTERPIRVLLSGAAKNL